MFGADPGKGNSMYKFIAALFALGLTGGPASATDTLDVMRTVWHYVDSFNKGDAKAALGDCAAQSSIIDEFPPYHWQGATACADWSSDFDAFVKKNGMTNSKLTLGRLKQADVSGDRAYVVIPATFAFTQNGKRTTETGSLLTVTLQKAGDDWQITAWAWSKH
jgi:hypothetical protein